ncbi:hypothetical protein BLNAU_13245 [Blattamonas nauphoetae]|uniref:Uncharacterized protein n=1 Tax=Blattamonas nauphoetae TaxID=2049346 RepID=A0ABQ9XK78_9EUKA|nr:hypothetical protein BLNAU_13240 [Blattamonas nauphoetae]KAK2951875.1 hypothetical protein BLNAU_13245 [Blattamonas nauphoetae]
MSHSSILSTTHIGIVFIPHVSSACSTSASSYMLTFPPLIPTISRLQLQNSLQSGLSLSSTPKSLADPYLHPSVTNPIILPSLPSSSQMTLVLSICPLRSLSHFIRSNILLHNCQHKMGSLRMATPPSKPRLFETIQPTSIDIDMAEEGPFGMCHIDLLSAARLCHPHLVTRFAHNPLQPSYNSPPRLFRSCRRPKYLS